MGLMSIRGASTKGTSSLPPPTVPKAPRVSADASLPPTADWLPRSVVCCSGVSVSVTGALLLNDADCTRVIKSKSMVSEEIGLNPALEAAGGQVITTEQNFTSHVVIDRELLTAQNPMSDHELAVKFMAALEQAA